MDSEVDDERLFRTIVDRTRASLPGLRRLILFGSHARGMARDGSDIDLVAIVDDPPIRRPRTLGWRLALSDLAMPFDLAVLSPAEWESARAIPGSAVAAADVEGRLLYAA